MHGVHSSPQLGARNLNMSKSDQCRKSKQCSKTLTAVIEPSGSYSGFVIESNDNGKQKLFCEYCGKGFISKNGLQNHLNSHRGNYKFNCQICGKGFQAKSNLDGHMNSHLNFKPHVCEICNKGFSFKFAAMRHKLDCHKDYAS